MKLTLAAAICWENYMPLLRQSLYSQNVNLYLAPTADARDSWLALMRTVAAEGRCVVLSANQCVRKGSLPGWITGEEEEGEGEEADGVGEVQAKSQTPPLAGRRRFSVMEDGNEIALPCPKGEANGRVEEEGDGVVGEEQAKSQTTLLTGRRRFSVIEDGNEIVLPCPKDEVNGRAEEEGGEEPVITGGQSKSASKSKPKGEFVSRGGSCIVSPLGDVLAGPLWEDEDGLLVVEVDMDDCVRGRLDLDVGGHYSRSDAFRLTVEGLDLSPPP